MSHHEMPLPIDRKIFTPGVFVLLLLIFIGLCFGIYRFIFGLASVTNLDQQHPWGLWIAIDVATGVALAAGGFTTAALAHIFHREHYEPVCRPALLTAMLGYTFVGIGLMADLGRYYNIWHPAYPVCWQGNSVLFEVGMCVMCYLTVLYSEFAPIVCERFMDDARFPLLSKIATIAHSFFNRIMFLLIIAGVVLSCLHQSSLGNLMVIAPSKMSMLWWTPILSLLFLLSAIAVGFAMVTVESIYAAWSFKLKPEMNVLTPLAKYIPVLLGVYIGFKLGDMVMRGSYVYIWREFPRSIWFLVEMIFGLIVPFAMLLSPKVRESTRLLFIAALMIVLGVALNRVNVFLVAYEPPYATKQYYPSIGEFAVTIGLVSALILIYRLCATYLPIISHEGKPEAARA